MDKITFYIINDWSINVSERGRPNLNLSSGQWRRYYLHAVFVLVE